MPVPAIVAGAAAVAGRLAAKKVAKEVTKKATKKAVEKIAKNSVKVVPKKRNAMEDAQRISANRAETNMAAERKSGALAKITASRVNTNPRAGVTGKERIVVKVNSANKAKSANAAKSSNAKLSMKNGERVFELKRNQSDKIFDFKFVEVVSPLSLLSNDQSSNYENQYLNFWNIDQVI